MANKMIIDISKVLFISIFLFLVADFFISRYFKQFLYDAFGEGGVVRIANTVYHHDLAPNLDINLSWGDSKYRLCTDTDGFKTSCGNRINNNKHSIAFIGDSFTEGVGLAYPHTIPGIIETKNIGVNAINMGVSSYSPSIYYSKVKYYLDKGLKFKKLFVLVDISDIQDEGINIKLNEDRAVSKNFMTSKLTGSTEYFLNAYWMHLKQYFIITANLRNASSFFNFFSLKIINQKSPLHVNVVKNSDFKFGASEYARSEWTSNRDSPHYGEGGVQGAKEQAIFAMTKLSNLLKAQGIELIVVVYPWPMQLIHGVKEHEGVTLWREFCKKKCDLFVDANAPFFEIRKMINLSTLFDKYYQKSSIQNDVHFNMFGNEIIVNEILRSSPSGFFN